MLFFLVLAEDVTLGGIELCLHARKFPGLVGGTRDAVLEFPGPDVSGLQAWGRISLPWSSKAMSRIFLKPE